MLIAHTPLKPQCQTILKVMIERGSITKREAAEFDCWNLPARILEIREAFGADAVETVTEPNRGRGTHGRYYWRGDIAEQRELGL